MCLVLSFLSLAQLSFRHTSLLTLVVNLPHPVCNLSFTFFVNGLICALNCWPEELTELLWHQTSQLWGLEKIGICTKNKRIKHFYRKEKNYRQLAKKNWYLKGTNGRVYCTAPEPTAALFTTISLLLFSQMLHVNRHNHNPKQRWKRQSPLVNIYSNRYVKSIRTHDASQPHSKSHRAQC